MGSIVLAACTSHSPGITGFPERADPAAAGHVLDGFAELATGAAASDLDAIVAVSSEHFTNLFLSNFPAFSVGSAREYPLPASDAFSRFLRIPRIQYPGHERLGEVLYEGLLRRDFDPSLMAGAYGFDEGFSVPLTLLDTGAQVPVVPIVVNSVHPPYPSLRRCHALGTALAEIISDQHVAERVMVLGTGGLSHWVGLPGAGQIDPDFDRRVLDAFEQGRADELLDLTNEDIDRSGNGAHEIRSWLVVAGATGASPYRTLAYEAVPAWLTGTSIVRAELDTADPEGVR